MAIIPGQDILASDFITTSSGASDSGKVTKLDTAGKHPLGGFNYAEPAITLTLGMTVAANEAVYVADGSEANVAEVAQTSGGANCTGFFKGSGDRLGQTFSLLSTALYDVLKEVVISMGKFGSPTGTVSVSLYAVDGSNNPTGAALSTGTLAASSVSGTQANNTFTMSAYTLVRGTTYVFVISHAAGTPTDYIEVYHDSGLSGYSGQIRMSTDSGATWVSDSIYSTGDPGPGDNLRFTINCGPVAGQVYLTDADSAEQTDNFVGFMYESGSSGQSKKVTVGAGVVGGFTGLTVGVTYYLSGTKGAIQTSAGSTSRKVGIAISTTQLLFRPTNP